MPQAEQPHAAASSASPSRFQPRAVRRVAIIGYGSIGHRHAENLLRCGIEQLIVLRRASQTNQAFTLPAKTQVVHSLPQLLAAAPDLAIVTNPTSLHASVAQPLLEAGIATVVEKPITADLATARQLVETAHRHGTWAAMAYPLRFHPAYVLAQRLITSGQLAPVLYGHVWFESYLPDWHPWEDYRQSYAARPELGGGVLPTLDHEIDFLNWTLGPLENVSGHLGRSNTLQADVDDMALLVARHSGHGPIMLRLSLCRPDRQRGFEFVARNATLRYDDRTGRLEQIDHVPSDPSPPFANNTPSFPSPPHRGRPQTAPHRGRLLWQDDGHATNAMYRDLIAAMLNALRAGAAPPVPLEAGLAALEFCHRAGAPV